MTHMGPMAGPSMMAGGLFFILWFLMMAGMIVGWIFFLVAIWRGMKAHESIAKSLKIVLNKNTEEQ